MAQPFESKGAGLNMSLFLGGAFGLAASTYWPDAHSLWQHQVLAWALAAGSATSTARGVTLFAKDIAAQRAILKSEEPGTDHGSAREATEKEMEERGCFDPSSGSFLGFKFGRAVFGPPDAPFAMFESPPGGGKDIFLNNGNVLHRSLLGQSVFASDVKIEIAPMLVQGLEDASIETWCVNPANKHPDICGNVVLGLYQALIDAVHSENGGQKDAVGIVQQFAALHLPDEMAEGGKKYFSAGAKRALSIPPLLNALVDPTRCNPTRSNELLNDPEAFIRVLKTILTKLESVGSDKEIVAHLQGEARNLLSRAETNPENFGSFLEWATQCLLPFSRAGHLADYGQHAERNIKALCERPITLFVMTPQSHMKEFEAFASILNANLLSAIKRQGRKQRIHLSLNEFLNYKFPDIASDLEIIRGFGVTADFFIQSYNGLVRKYGKETAASVSDYCDVKVFFGLNSYERAKHVSNMLSETTIAGRDYSYRPNDPSSLNATGKRHARPLMTADEILSMPRDQAWVFIKGLRPIKVHLAHYGVVDPWKKMVSDNPHEGPPLQGKTLLKINYANNGDRP